MIPLGFISADVSVVGWCGFPSATASSPPSSFNKTDFSSAHIVWVGLVFEDICDLNGSNENIAFLHPTIRDLPRPPPGQWVWYLCLCELKSNSVFYQKPLSRADESPEQPVTVLPACGKGLIENKVQKKEGTAKDGEAWGQPCPKLDTPCTFQFWGVVNFLHYLSKLKLGSHHLQQKVLIV